MKVSQLENIAEKFQEISGEVILKRRQHVFLELYNLDEEHKSFLRGLVSLSVALKTSYNYSPRVSVNHSDIPFPEAMGKVLYFLFEEDSSKIRRELHKLPKYLQVIISFVISKRIVSQVTHEFMFNTLDNLQTMPEMLSTFVKMPIEQESSEAFLEKTISFSRNNELDLPFYVVKRAKAQRSSGKLYYLVKTPDGVHSNIPNKMVKDYLAKSSRLSQYGVIVSLNFSRKRSRVKYLQVVAFSEDYIGIKSFYQSKSKQIPKLLSFSLYFKPSPTTIEITVKHPIEVKTIEELEAQPWNLLNGNLIFHKNGISVLNNKSYKVRGKVVDWLLSETYEPLGYVVSYEGNLYDIKCSLKDSDIDRGIEGLFLSLSKTEFMGKVIKMNYHQVLSRKFRECSLCGAVESLISKELCYKCHTHLYKVAVASHFTNFEYDTIKPFKAGVKFPMYKYDVEFSEVSIGFSENLELVRGTQLRLPCNWWDREDWLDVGLA